jgi:O-antigen/teichoic acid export membrane protein
LEQTAKPPTHSLLRASPYFYLILSTAVRLASGLIIFKFLASQFGPSTFGLLTQVMGIAAIFYMFADGGIANGIIRNISAAPSEFERKRWMSAGTTITVASSVALAAVAVIASGMIYFVRDYLLLAVYSKQFLIASHLVLPQLVGDSLKVTFLLLQYYFMSRQQMFVIFVSELILGLALYTLYLVLVPAYGIVAPIHAYAGVYAALALALIALLAVTKGGAKSLTS